jgi:cystathionine beta-lyase/cystathionine gamma-synthase
MEPKSLSKETSCIHEGTFIDEVTQGINTPIYTSTSNSYLDMELTRYPRYFNSKNQEALTKKICSLENAEAGMIFSSGMAAISTTLLSFLSKGDHVIFQTGLYGGTFKMIGEDLERFGIQHTIVKNNEIKEFENAIRQNTKVIYIETPSNPLLLITDIEAVAKLAKSKNIISVIDNTFASPVNQNPLDFGINIVVHSATKYLGGHSDICAGVAVSTQDYISKIRKTASNLGGSLNAETCYLLERSIKTLFVRVQRQNENAMAIAEFLSTHSQVKKVHYPGLKTHKNHEIAQKQMKSFGGMLAFELKNGDSIKFQKTLKIIKPAISLGGVDTIICSPALTSHRHLSKEERLKEGITDGLLRLSVGIENINDLIADLEQAL